MIRFDMCGFRAIIRKQSSHTDLESYNYQELHTQKNKNESKIANSLKH